MYGGVNSEELGGKLRNDEAIDFRKYQEVLKAVESEPFHINNV